MKITFPDRSYIELIKSNISDKIIITIAARDSKEPLTTIANSVELSLDQLKQLISIE
jgi:hypothetical protein